MRDFRQLKVWQKSRQLALEVYKASAPFPRDEMYGLTSQIRRAATSIPANIAEGCGRGSEAELAHYMQVAMGSASELESHLIIAMDLGYLTEEAGRQVLAEVTEVKKMLSSFIVRLRG